MFRIDYVPGTNSPKYGKPVTVRETYLNEEYAVTMEHYETGIYFIYLFYFSFFFGSFNIKILYLILMHIRYGFNIAIRNI